MSAPHERRKKKLQAWKAAVLCGVVALSVSAGLLYPGVRRSPNVEQWQLLGGLLLSGLTFAWCLIDARLRRYDIDHDDSRHEMAHLLAWLPVIGVFYYLLRSRDRHERWPDMIKAALFMALMAVFFQAARRYSMLPF